VGPTDVSNKGNRYILTFQDDLTKFMVAIPIPTQDAETVAREFVLNIVLKYGIPEVILTDQVANIFSELFTNVCSCKSRKFKRPRSTQNRTAVLSGVIGSLSDIFDIISRKINAIRMNG